MTKPTPHGQVPDALIDLIDAYAETRHRYGGIYNARTEAARKAVIEALSGVQALSAAPEAIAKLRHLYQNMVNGAVRDTASAKRIAEGLLAPAIEALERATPPAEQQATKETSGGFHVWRDISTAPKDGSRFVATGHNYGLYSEVRHTCVAQWFRGCWMEASDWNETSELKYLTHWMPLPSPPDDVAAPAEQQAAYKAVPGGPLTRDQIREVFMAHGFTVKEGQTDLKQYVYDAAHALLELVAAPQQEAQEPAFWMNEKGHTWSHSDWKQFPKHRAKYPIPLYAHRPPPLPAPDCHHRPPCNECAAIAAQGGKV